MTMPAGTMEIGVALRPSGAGTASGEPPRRLRCCDASACRNAGGIALRQALLAARNAAGLGEDTLAIRAVGCLRLCGRGPLVAADGPAGSRLWGGVPPPLAEPLLAAALEAAGADPLAPFSLDLNHPFFRLQKPVVLERCGRWRWPCCGAWRGWTPRLGRPRQDRDQAHPADGWRTMGLHRSQSLHRPADPCWPVFLERLPIRSDLTIPESQLACPPASPP
jgi:hypothetical protein